MRLKFYSYFFPSGILSLTLLVILFSCNNSTEPSTKTSVVNQVDYPFRHQPDKKFRQISAHRGGGDIPGYPENCLESMMYIADQNRAWMEIDIRKTRDGHLILMHDASIDRTTNSTGRVENLSWPELQDVKLKDNNGRQTEYQIPLLRDVLLWNEKSGHTILNLDIKNGVSYEDVLDLVHETNQLDNVIAIVYDIRQAIAMRRIDENIVISLPVRNMEEWERLQKSDLELDKLIAFTGTIRSDKALYDTLHANGLLTIFGTMGNIDRQAASRGKSIYEEFYHDGADILSTDRPLRVDL